MIGAPIHRKILVVEDDPDIQEALSRILESEGFEVVTASNGREALHSLRESRERRPGVVLLDLMMPVMDGWQFRAEQLKDPEIARIPVIVLSAHGGVKQHAVAIEAAQFLKKPIDLDLLLDSVRRHCTSDAA